jgi:hypothetical protein
VHYLCAGFQVQAFPKAVLRSIQIMNDKGRYHQQVMQRLPAMQGPRTLGTGHDE